MNIAKPLIKENIERVSYQEEQQLSPISKKRLFSKSKNINQLQPKHFNSSQQKLKTKNQIKHFEPIPNQQSTLNKNTPSQIFTKVSSPRRYIKVLKTRSNKSTQKLKSLKQFSFIETVSQKSGIQNQEHSDIQLQMSNLTKPLEINSLVSSPFDFLSQHQLNSFTHLHNMQLNTNRIKTMKSSEFERVKQQKSQRNGVLSKTNKFKSNFNGVQNDKKTNKLSLTRQLNQKQRKSFKIQKSVVEITIAPFKSIQNLFPSEQINVQESNIIFDYNKFYIGKSTASKSFMNSIQKQKTVHSINQNLFRFFYQEKKQQKNFGINNLNQSFINIVKDINSPHHNTHNKNLSKNVYLMEKSQVIQNENKNNLKVNDKSPFSQILCSELTSLVTQGPRTHSLGKQLKKLNGSHNKARLLNEVSLISLKYDSKKTTAKSSFLSNLECLTPKKSSQYSPNTIKFVNEHKQPQKKYLNEDNEEEINHFKKISSNKCKNSLNHHRFITINSSLQKYKQNPHIGFNSNHQSPIGRRSKSKGISVSSKQKRMLTIQNTQTKHNYNIHRSHDKTPCTSKNSKQKGLSHPIQNIFVSSKLKSLNELKNMKKLRLLTDERIQEQRDLLNGDKIDDKQHKMQHKKGLMSPVKKTQS